MAAQPGQCRAHRGLAEADPLPSTGDIALFEQGAQRHDKVHVKSGEIHDPAPSMPWIEPI